MKPMLVCNWKTYVKSEDDARSLASAIAPTEKAELIVCPSAMHIAAVADIAKEKGIALGAQEISVSAEKPETGNVSAEQVRNMGVTYAIVGHAETRANGVTNRMVAEKAIHALRFGIIPIICLSGRSENQERDEIEGQMREALEILDQEKNIKAPAEGVIAYEPIDRIGAGAALEPSAIREISDGLREMAGRSAVMRRPPIIYGGAVDRVSAGAIMREGGVDGLLIGRAGVDPNAINAIVASIA